MVTINHEVIDHLPCMYLKDFFLCLLITNLPDTDIPISTEERDHVEELIRNEIQHNDHSQLHPLVNTLVPLSLTGSNSLSLAEIERYEEEMSQAGEPGVKEGTQIITGIESFDFEVLRDQSTNSEDYDKKLLENLYFAINENSNLVLLQQNGESLKQLNIQYEEEIRALESQLSGSLERKRKQVEEINILRKKRQVNDFEPVNNYLMERWKDGIKSVVDLGVESARLDMDL